MTIENVYVFLLFEEYWYSKDFFAEKSFLDLNWLISQFLCNWKSYFLNKNDSSLSRHSLLHRLLTDKICSNDIVVLLFLNGILGNTLFWSFLVFIGSFQLLEVVKVGLLWSKFFTLSSRTLCRFRGVEFLASPKHLLHNFFSSPHPPPPKLIASPVVREQFIRS